MSLTDRQRRFVDEYLIDLNATAAYKRAGYKGKGHVAESGASEILSNPEVAEYIAARMKDREKRTEITQDRVLQELARIAFFDIRKLYNENGTLKRPSELDDDAAAALAGIDVVEVGGDGGAVPMLTKKAKVFDKGTALTLAMRHLGMLTDKVEMTGKGGGPIAIKNAKDMTDDELANIAAGGGAGVAGASKG